MPAVNASPGRSSLSEALLLSSPAKQESSRSHREEKAAYLLVKTSLDSPLESFEELAKVLQQTGRNPTKKLLHKYWGSKTKVITFQDVCRILKDEPENTEEELKKAFRKIDKNLDGHISYEELKYILLKKGENLTEAEISVIFEGADLNADGKIDYNEFVAMVQKTAWETREAAVKRLDRLEKAERREKAAKRRERTKEHRERSPLVINGKSHDSHPHNGLHQILTEATSSGRRDSVSSDISASNGCNVSLRLPPPKDQYRPGSDEKALKDWFRIRRKGCFFYDEEFGQPLLSSHKYRLRQNVSQTICFLIFPFANTNMQATSSSSLPVDTVLFLLQTRPSYKVVACTTQRDNEGCFHCRCFLESGEYIILPYTTGCRFRPRKEKLQEKHKSNLIESDSSGKFCLTKQFRMVLMNVFELFDLDESGGLNREEFNLYNIRTGDEHVSNEEWEVVKKNFDTKSEELSLKGFIQLHQMEAEDGQGDTEDMWVSLQTVGYNYKLQMDEVCPYMVEIFSEDGAVGVAAEAIHLISTSPEWKAVVEYLFQNSTLLRSQPVDQLTVRAFVSSFWSILLFSEGSEKSDEGWKVEEADVRNLVFAVPLTTISEQLNHKHEAVLPMVPKNEDEEIYLSLTCSNVN